MMLVWLCFLSPVITALMHAVLQRAWFSKVEPKSRQVALVRIIVLMTFVYTLCGLYWGFRNHENYLVTAAYMLIGSTGFQFAYFHLFNMSETARRVNICVSCFKAARQKVPKAWVPERYSNQFMIEMRLDRLLAMGAMEKRGERYFSLNGWILKAARGLEVLHTIYFPKRR